MVQRAGSHDDVYDRQIRLWGADAQKRMSNARVLYINLTGVTCEIMKNLVLAGVAAVILDSRPYPDAVRETPSYFFRAEEMEQIIRKRNEGNQCSLNIDVDEPQSKKAKTENKEGQTVAAAVAPIVEELNPLLSGRNSIENRPLSSLPDSYFCQFDAIVASKLSVDEAKRVSACLRSEEKLKSFDNCADNENSTSNSSTLFIIADTFGFDGCAHLDFGINHWYRRELGKDKLSEIMRVKPYVSMTEMLEMPLSKANGRWDESPPRILVLQRLLMDFWERIRCNNRDTLVEEETKKKEFIDFARNWISSNGITANSLKHDDGHEILFEDFAGVALHPEVLPVAAVLGGVLGNEVIKALTRKGEPANNVLLFSGLDGGCRSFVLGGDKS